MSDKNDFDDFTFDDYSVEDDEEILEDFEDENDDGTLTEDQQRERVDAYFDNVNKYSKMVVKPKTFNKQQRLEAIQWLGESGNPEAIMPLLKVYHKDKTPGMKEAAAFALGQFKAYKRDEDDPETNEMALQRVDEFILYDKRGKSANTTLFILGEVILVAVAIVLLAFGGILASQNASERALALSQTQTAQPTPTMDTEDALRNDLRTQFTGMVTDANFYQQQLASATRGDGIQCNLDAISNAPNYDLSPMWQDNATYSGLVSELNSTNTSLRQVAGEYRQACNSGVAPPREEALQLGETIINVQRSLADLRDQLAAAGVTVTDEAIATPDPAAPPTVDPSIPTPTRDVARFETAISTMQFTIDSMLETQGPAQQNVFNWEQVVTNNELYLSGCNQPRPVIPNDYTLDSAIQGASSLLDSAVNNLNTGLQSVRFSVQAFYDACAAGEVPPDAVGRSAQAQLGLTAIEAAQNDLNALRN